MQTAVSIVPPVNARKWIACILLAALLLAMGGCSGTQQEKGPRAVAGVLDLTHCPLSGGRVIALDGQWEFYWDQLLTPVSFRGNVLPEPTGLFSLPGTWRGYRHGATSLGGTGKATYRLRVLSDRTSGRLVLRIFDIHEAYKLWANGKLIAQSGEPGDSAATEKPARTDELAEIPFQGRPIELVLQVSNYHFRRGGVTEPILAALPGPLEFHQARDWAISIFFAGCMLIMGIYHLVLYYWRKRDIAPLYFGLYCLLVVGYSVTSNASRWVITLLFPQWDPTSMETFSLTCFICWASLLYRFLKVIYPDEFHTFPMYLLDARIPIFTILLIFAPGVPLYWFIAICLMQLFLFAGYYLQRVTLCVRRGRIGAKILLVGLLTQFLAGINDPLVHMGIIKTVYLVEPAVFLFVLSQSLVLSKRFSSSFESVEQLSIKLEQKNRSLRDEIEERNRLEQLVVNISEEERRRLSYELHDSLCQQLTGARLRASALSHEHAGDKDGPELAELAGILKTSTRDAYKIARGLYPVEPGETGPSLKNLVHSIAETTGINIAFNRKCRCDQCTSENIIPLYRIAQEALANAAKHSGASNIKVELDCCENGKITLRVVDDGVGWKKSGTTGRGLGMSIMHHRAKVIKARLRIENGPLGGTQIICTASCGVPNIGATKENHDG